MTTETIGSRVREQRTRLQLSQQALANMAGVSQGLIGQIEAGINKSSKHTVAIASALGVSPEWLEGRGSPPAHQVDALQMALPPESQWLLRAWQHAGAESKEVARFALSDHDAPLPPWADREIRDQLDSMKYKAMCWLRREPEQKNLAA